MHADIADGNVHRYALPRGQTLWLHVPNGGKTTWHSMTRWCGLLFPSSFPLNMTECTGNNLRDNHYRTLYKVERGWQTGRDSQDLKGDTALSSQVFLVHLVCYNKNVINWVT